MSDNYLAKMWAPCMPDSGSMEIAADAFAEAGDIKMEALLRMYANNLTEIGTFKFEELQKEFKYNVETGNGYLFDLQLGYFYTRLTVSSNFLLKNPSLMEQQPIRNLQIRLDRSTKISDLSALMRSYRIANLTVLNFILARNISSMETAIKEINGIKLMELIIDQTNDNYRRIELAFAMNPKIRKGCKLIVNNRELRTKN